MLKIIVSGSEGFVGKHLTSKLLKNKKIKLIKMNRKFFKQNKKRSGNSSKTGNYTISFIRQICF